MKYLVIGGVAGGASVAARLRRMDENAEIVLFERGPYISYANCGLPYYIGDTIRERERLFLQTPGSFRARFHVDIRVYHEVIAINPAAKTVKVLDQSSGQEYIEVYDKLALSPGAEPIRPPIPGIDLPGIFSLRNVSDTDDIKNFIRERKVQKALIIGGGFIGLEMAENLHQLGIQVSIAEMADQVMAPLDYEMAAPVHRHLKDHGVALYLREEVIRFEKHPSGMKVFLKSGRSMDTEMVLLSIGVRADTRLARAAGLNIGEAGGILVNEFMQTSDPDIYAVGDAIEFPDFLSGKSRMIYLAGPANKQARICADNMVGGPSVKYKGAIGTGIAKIFDMTVATTGLSAKGLKRNQIPFLESVTHSGSHAGYYPGSLPMSIKICFSPLDGTLYGAQIAGYQGVDKRIDMMAAIIGMRGTVYDLTELEHAYAPPFSSAKDPVNMAGYVAENILRGRHTPVYWHEMAGFSSDKNVQIVDVRTTREYAEGCIPGSVNIPLDELRFRMKELVSDRKIIVYCAVGLRGYVAERILRQHNYSQVFNLSGGYKTWQSAVESQLDQETKTKISN